MSTARAWAWVEHLRHGGSTPWAAYDGSAAPADPLLPGAIQLEVVRRLNELDGRDDPAHRALVEQVLVASAPGRGQPDLELVGVHDGSPFGPPPVDPADLPADELLRMAVGVIADVALDRDPGPLPATPLPRAAPWKRGWTLAGDPLLCGQARTALLGAGIGKGRRSPVVVVLGTGLDTVLADVWSWRVRHRVTPSWAWWVGSWSRRGTLPPRADLAAAARHWAGEVGPERVHVVVGGALPASLLGLELAPRSPRLPLSSSDVLRRVNEVLRVQSTDERHQRLLDHVVVPLLAGERGPAPGVPEQHRAWLADRAAAQVEALRDGGYPVHGDLATLLPSEAGGDAELEAPEILDVALRALLRAREPAVPTPAGGTAVEEER